MAEEQKVYGIHMKATTQAPLRMMPIHTCSSLTHDKTPILSWVAKWLNNLQLALPLHRSVQSALQEALYPRSLGIVVHDFLAAAPFPVLSS